MSAHVVHGEGCGHASCAARLRGREAAGKAAYEFWAETQPRMYVHWDYLLRDRREFWMSLVEAAEDVFWEAWLAG